MLLFNRQLSSSVGGGGKDKGLWHHRQSHMPQPQLHGYLTEGQLPLLLASLAFAAQHIKIFDEGSNIFFSIESSLNPFFSSSFNNNFRTSGKKPHIICTNTNLQQQGGKKVKGEGKKTPEQQPSAPNPRQLAAASEKDTHFPHAKTPLLPPPSPAWRCFPNKNPLVGVLYTIRLWDKITYFYTNLKPPYKLAV